jgi:hypothetical protein
MLKTWLDFASRLIWPLLVFAFLAYFRRQLTELLEGFAGAIHRLAKVKVGDYSYDFWQPPDPDAPPVGVKAEKELRDELTLREPNGFFTRHGVASVIEGSDLAEPGEKIGRTLLLFQTEKQRTWLAASRHRLFCVLDDDAPEHREGSYSGYYNMKEQLQLLSNTQPWTLVHARAGCIRTASTTHPSN